MRATSPSSRARRRARQAGAPAPQQDAGFTLAEMLVSLVILVAVITAFMLVLVTTTRATAGDDFRGRASQLAAQEVERLRAVPWTSASVLATSPTKTCVGSELARTTTAPGVPPQRQVVDVSGRSFTVTNAVSWVGTSCTTAAAQPVFGQLRLTSTVSWTDRGRARSTTTTNFRVPPPEVASPALTGAVTVVAPTASASASASPAASAAPSASPTPAGASPSAAASPVTTTSPSPVVPEFTGFTPAAPASFCVYGGETIAALPISVQVTNVLAGEQAKLTWSGPPANTAGIVMTYGGLVNGKHSYSATVPAGSSFATGATQLQVGIAATSAHTAGTYVQTFSVTAAQNKNKC